MTTHHPFVWYDIVTTDVDAAADFYSAVAGWSIATASGVPMDYRHLTASDGAQVGGARKCE
jgi:uncharacterized protein